MRIGITDIEFWSLSFSGDGKLNPSHALTESLNSYSESIFNSFDVIFQQAYMDKQDPFYPNPSDLKVMREDTIAAVVLARRILHRSKFTDDTIREMGLMFANSNFIDNDILEFDTISQAIGEIQNSLNEEAKNKTLGAGISPLIPLRTLTNGTESFIAQYTKIQGENATYGSTCISTVHALKDAMNTIALGISENAMVGGSHYANGFSFLNQYLNLDCHSAYKESTSSALILIESEVAISRNNHTVLLWIESIDFNSFTETTKDVVSVFWGGSFTPKQTQELYRKLLRKFDVPCCSLFEKTGSLGCAEMVFLLAWSNENLESGQSSIIYLEDILGEFVCLKVQKP
jgi:hypothetical protein